MKILDFLALILLVIALGMGVYLMWLNLDLGGEFYDSFSAEDTQRENVSGVSGEIVQFFPNMRYRDRTISYRLESVCTQTKWTNIQRAFSIISERTSLEFYSSKTNPEIIVLCSGVSPNADEEGHFIAGEGGPSKIVNTTNFAVILSGKISLYRDEKCDEPKIAIHEILHALGFDHYNNSKSILYPVTGCDQEIDGEIINDINGLYSVDSLPDLTIENLIVNLTGRYLNFNMTVTNVGLADSKNARADLYADSKKVANFTLEDLEIGTKSLLTVQNVKLPRGVDGLVFVVSSDDAGELNLVNNRITVPIN